MKIVLIGFMCSGKSKVGRLLARRLGWPYYDTDEMIAKQEGTPVPGVMARKGLAVFREIEKKIVQSLSFLDNCVISTGGGVPLDPENMKALGYNGEIVWLQVSPEVVLKRAGDLTSRPLIDPKDPMASIKKILKERTPAYSVAKHTVDTDDLGPDFVVERILELLPNTPR